MTYEQAFEIMTSDPAIFYVDPEERYAAASMVEDACRFVGNCEEIIDFLVEALEADHIGTRERVLRQIYEKWGLEF